MWQLAQYVRSHGFSVAFFNYHSYAGIANAADDLHSRLSSLEAKLRNLGIGLVGHSMGGLVSRYYAVKYGDQTPGALRAVAMLGTPNRGALSPTLKDRRRIVNYMLHWAETVAPPDPFARSLGCPALRELTGEDNGRLVSSLNQKSAIGLSNISLMSVSGGLGFIEMGRLRTRVGNIVLQRLLGERPNDGIVTESNSDITGLLGKSSAARHTRNYHDFNKINHTYLTRNPEIAFGLVTWLHSIFKNSCPQGC
jgi:pimeloyl-ACP methyl ester carboxylesterase